uniref:Ribosomal protein S5 C-terminal domain-containing protein n=1 Tax=Oryzias melastigma TaxID=30732 RepID=A0A3B3B8I0_ORYME
MSISSVYLQSTATPVLMGSEGGPIGPILTGRCRGARGGKSEDKEWVPVTKLGRMVKDMKIKSLEEIYLHSLPIKESEIIDFFLGSCLNDEELKIMPGLVSAQVHAHVDLFIYFCITA